MADIRLGNGNDVYVQPEADKNVWNNVFGEDGDDQIRLYQGIAIGGKGNDRFEKIPDPSNPGREMQVGYWDAGDNLKVNLAEGWAEDGLGGRDTLVGVRSVHGNGSKNAWVQGDAQDNFYWPNGGDDTFLGGAGTDTISINSQFQPAANATWRNALLDELDIQVSADGRQATVKPKFGVNGFLITVTDVEVFQVATDSSGSNWQSYRFADFITPQTMAEGAVAAGGALRWNAGQATGSAVTLSFSFVATAPSSGVGAVGFRAFTEPERQLVRDILARTALLTQLTFNEVAESGASAGQLRFGASQQAQTKGQAALPGTNGDAAGDVWMDVDSMTGIAPGTEGYQALLHEIGHALGLRHPRNVDAGDAWSVQLREQDDRIALSVMSQTPSSDGLFRADWGPLDVLALRHLYGTRSTGQGDTRYALGARESAAMTTIVDDGGVDTLDASALPTGVSLDLVPGHTGSAGLSAAGYSGVDNLGIAAGSWIEHAVGSAFDDVLLGNSLANELTGGAGNDWIDGGAATDTAVYAGARVDYELSNAFGKVFVRARDGASGFDTLLNIERLRFADQTLALSPTVLGADVAYTLDEDGRLSARLPDPSDVARGSVSYRLVGNAGHGTATLSADGQLVYTPAPDYWGRDSLAFEIAGATGSNRYLSVFDVLPVNDGAPVARNASYLVAGAQALEARLPQATDIDGDAIGYALAGDAKNGTLVLQSSGAFSYTGRIGFSGIDSFGFIVSDGFGGNNSYTATVQVVAIDALRKGTAAADVLAAQAGSDGYYGLAGNDRITPGAGNDLVDGGDGIDTVAFAGSRAGYRVTRTDYGWTVESTGGTDGLDRLTQVERLQFGDRGLALDLDAGAGSVAQILRALFGSGALRNALFVGIGLQLFDGGMSYADVVRLAVGTDEFAAFAGGRSNEAFVNHVYRNVVGVLPSPGELAEFKGLLDNGIYTQASLALLACQVPLNTAAAEIVGLATTGLEFTLPGG